MELIYQFNKGRYLVLLPPKNGIWYLMILRSVAQDLHENCSNFNKEVPPVNSEVLVDLKNIESPDLLNEYSFLCLQVNPIVGHLNFLLYDWKREVNHSLIKTPLKKIKLIWCRMLIFSQKNNDPNQGHRHFSKRI